MTTVRLKYRVGKTLNTFETSNVGEYILTHRRRRRRRRLYYNHILLPAGPLYLGLYEKGNNQ